MSVTQAPPRRGRLLLSVVPLLAGAAVAIALGVYGRLHEPSGKAIFIGPFVDVLAAKSWAATVVLLFVVIQLFTALWMFGRLSSRPAPSWVPTAHRTSGIIAFVVSLPVAFQCLWSLGYQTYSARVYVHSVLGCAFYGVFVAKVLNVRIKGLPRWMVPVAGGLLFTVFVVLWLVSSLWYFRNVSFPGF